MYAIYVLLFLETTPEDVETVVSSSHCTVTAERLNMAFFETSAKDKSCVDEAFFALTRDIKKRLGEHGGGGGGGASRTSGTVEVRQDEESSGGSKGKCGSC